VAHRDGGLRVAPEHRSWSARSVTGEDVRSLNSAPQQALTGPPARWPRGVSRATRGSAGSPPVFAGQSTGVRWAIHADLDQAGCVSISVTRTCNGTTTTSAAGGSPLRAGQLISTWTGRGPAGIPPFLVLRAAPEVRGARVILASGGRLEMALSPVIEDFGFRLGASPLPEEDQMAAIEISSCHHGTQIIDLWRPPVHRR